MMAADPIHVGIVYLETDYLESDDGYGSDEIPDRFIMSFTGGAAGTEMTEFCISTDKDDDGLSIGDLIFDTAAGGRGKEGWHPFKVTKVDSVTGDRISVNGEVADGTTELLVRLTNFKAGDLLEFSIDLDEVLRMHGDLDRFNAALDVIASGQEMQDSQFVATFVAPHYETASADALFANDFGDPAKEFGLRLPPDEGSSVDSRPSRSAAAVGSAIQKPKPVSISGTVWVDDNLNLRRDAGEVVLPGIPVALFRKNESTGLFVDTGHRQLTGANGAYSFGTALGLMPGEYQVVQTQPADYFSVGAVVGLVDGDRVGRAASTDILTGINIPLGDLHAVNYDFAEARPAQVSGFVYRDNNDNGRRDVGEPGLGGVTMRLVPLDTIAPLTPIETVTGADGSYRFNNLPPGRYDIIQVTQPAGLDDGRDAAGLVDGKVVGVADEPGDAIRGVILVGNSTGTEYNFGELPRGIITGGVYLAPPGEDCGGRDDGRSTPLAGVQIELVGPGGVTVARTTTGLDGQYRFEDVPKGIYSIIEVTPQGLLDGRAKVGTIAGVQVGTAVGGGLISNVVLPAGATGSRYDFCEAAPAQISGYVYHDRNDNGRREGGEEAIPGTTIQLVDAEGQVVATTQTDAQGQYAFKGVLPGNYSIRQVQPSGFIDGRDTAGTIDGTPVGTAVNPGDLLTGVAIRQGQKGVEYNFGELRPASLSGRVHVDDDGDCTYDPGERLLAGVTVRLFDSGGREVARTTTNAQGRYTFSNIVPGTYTVVEDQPEGFFSGTAKPGSAGGVKESDNRIGSITLGSGEVAVDYDFCEKPPAEISGFVYVDQNNNQRRDGGETAISGVRVDLIDASGRQVATTMTDASGYYRFSFLPEGQYTLRQSQPVGYLQGGQQAGSAGGNATVVDVISQIPIAYGSILTEYNFGELLPSSISGFVFVDGNGDCIRQDGEPGLAGVLIELFDGAGQLVTYTRTDASGFYEFEGLTPGQYRIVETQPDGYFSGAARPGSGGGRADGGDIITEIPIGPGANLTDYNFCEKAPASIAGQVYQDPNLNQRRDDGEQPVAGVKIELRDSTGSVIATTFTDSDGYYRFTGLRPGTYSIRQLQPDGLFHGGQVAGSFGGDDSIDDLIDAIVLPGGAVAVDYDFPEVPPASISGHVFQDGGPLVIENPPNPEDLRDYRDGQRKPGDAPLAGVVMQLRNVLGQPISADRAIPGYYDGVIEVVTDADGFYEFKGLRPGSYHIYQVQPDGYVDGLDTPGTGGGVAVNVADLVVGADPQVLSLLSTLGLDGQTDPRNDAILLVSLTAGSRSAENNFSEILIEKPVTPVPPVPPPAIPIIDVIAPPPGLFPFTPKVAAFGDRVQYRPPMIADGEYEVTWHLSVINGGFPRGNGFETDVKRVSASDFEDNFVPGSKRAGRWLLVDREGNRVEAGSAISLGEQDAIPLVGDFNGDGVDQVAIYVNGQWFVDLNSDGVWDEGDLWLRLGTELDRPVVGDWDGDGKTDIAIFGRQWERDPEAILRDPGLPSPANTRRREYVQSVSAKKVDLEQRRELRRGSQGEIRADAIDHVFRYGEAPDTPVAGDWNGDGIDTVGVFRAGQWTVDSNGDGRLTDLDDEIAFGQPGDVPIVGDWNGDGISNLGVIRGDVWIIDSDGDRRITGNDLQIQIPKPSDDAVPIVGDWNGDGSDEFGWFHNEAG
jgi:protocatechuate 3,4-dioxygenase beta subunit